MTVRGAEEVSWADELNLYAFVGNDPVNDTDFLGLQRPVRPGLPTPPPMQPPSSGGIGGGIGHAIELIVDGIAFGGELGHAKSMATLAALGGAFDELCHWQYSRHPNPASSGCGCCVMIIWVAREHAAQPPSFFNPGGSPPGGRIIGVRGANIYYVPRECDSISRSTEFPEAMWPGPRNTTEFVIKKPK